MVPTPVTTKAPFKPTLILTYNPHNPPLKEWFNEGYGTIKVWPKTETNLFKTTIYDFQADPQFEKNPDQK